MLRQSKLSIYSDVYDYLQDVFAKYNLLLERAQQGLQQTEPFADQLASLNQQIAARENLIKERLSLSRRQNVVLPIEILADVFHLSTVEIELVLICLLPYVDEYYHRAYHGLQINKNDYYPCLALFNLLLAPSNLKKQLQIRASLLPGTTLMDWQLLLRMDNGQGPLTAYTPLTLDPLIVNYLLGMPITEPELNLNLIVANTEPTIIPLSLHPLLEQQLEHLGRHIQDSINSTDSYILHFRGMDTIQLTKTAVQFAERLSFNTIFIIDADYLLSFLTGARFNKALAYAKLKQLFRTIILAAAHPCIRHFERLETNDPEVSALRQFLLTSLATTFTLSLLVSTTSTLAANDEVDFTNTHYVYIDDPLPNFEQRDELWQTVLNHSRLIQLKPLATLLADKFLFTASQIYSVQQEVLDQAMLCDKKQAISEKALLLACQNHSKLMLPNLATKYTAKAQLSDVILTEHTQNQVYEICQRVKYRREVYQNWGFVNKTKTQRPGLCVIFHGVSGTGKTMTAGAIANELGQELYTINLAMMVSKYIGETEKNLARLFDEAESLNAILFFDEADAIFGKRAEVKDAHDRFANIQTGYLLQRIETYQGIVILATNLLKNIDEAFVRRLDFIIEFHFPNVVQREELWKKAFPKQAPLASDIDYPFLAAKVKLAGGHITNIALRAAFYAVVRQQAITMQHILLAAREEYYKIGTGFLENDFAPYEHYFLTNDSDEFAKLEL